MKELLKSKNRHILSDQKVTRISIDACSTTPEIFFHTRLNLVSRERESPDESCGGGPNQADLLITEKTRDKS